MEAEPTMEKRTYERALGEIREDPATLRLLAPAYAGREGELTAVLQYVFQSIVFGESGNTDAAHTVLRIAVSEMRHLELLGTMIAKLGAPPVFTACPPYPVSYYSAACVNYIRIPRRMISADICAEENAVACYERILCRVKNPPVASVVSHILGEEREHLKLFNELLEKV